MRRIREHAFPDGTLTVRYGFVHALYQNALYASLSPTRKATWSAAGARGLLDYYGDKSAAVATELALLFEAGRDFDRALDQFLVAAENAARVFAHHEAVALARRGLALLQTLPDTLDRARRELPLQVTLGVQLQVAQGYAAPEAERTYVRARTLCEQMPEAPSLFRVLWGLWMFHYVRSELGKTWELAERLVALAQTAGPGHSFRPASAAATSSASATPPPRAHMDQGVALTTSSDTAPTPTFTGRIPASCTCLWGGGPVVARLPGPGDATQPTGRRPGRGTGTTQLAGGRVLRAMLQQYRREGRRSRRPPRPPRQSPTSTGCRSGLRAA